MIKLPQPEEVNEKDKENAFGAYIMMFASTYFPLPLIEIILSFIYYKYYIRRSRYVSFHAYQSFLGQIPITLVNTALFIYAIYLFVNLIKLNLYIADNYKLFYILLIITVLYNIIYIIVSLVIGIKAKKGIVAYFPIVGKIAYDKFYGLNPMEISPKVSKLRRNVSPD